MNTLKPVSRQSLSEQVAWQVVHMISAGRWKQGEKLPSEADMCKVFQIGRSTLREALKSLAFVGVIRMRAGEGTYVAENPSKFIDRILAHGLLRTEKDVANLCETRAALETELAALCAERATPEDLQDIESFVRQMHGPVPVGDDQFVTSDMLFHFAIAAGSKNQVLSQLLQTIRNLLAESITLGLEVPGAREQACQEHAAILKAIRQRSPQEARAAMSYHLKRTLERYKHIKEAPVEGLDPVSSV